MMPTRSAKLAVVVGLVLVVGLAFRVSWNALKDIATAIGADSTAAVFYPFVVDGLMALALIATLVLVGSDRKFALWTLGGYTAASLALNFVHGLEPQLHHPTGRVPLADWAPAHWGLVLLATSLPVGAIFLGSDLVARVLHHAPESISDLGEDVAVELTESAPVADVESADSPIGTPTFAKESAPAPRRAVVAESTGARPRRATGSVPESARSARPTRTAEELLHEAMSVTADWPDSDLNAEAIRKALRTSAANARTLRDLLQGARAQRVDAAITAEIEASERRTGLHVVTNPDAEIEAADLEPVGVTP